MSEELVLRLMPLHPNEGDRGRACVTFEKCDTGPSPVTFRLCQFSLTVSSPE